MNHYKAFYDSFTTSIKGKSLTKLKYKIEKAAKYSKTTKTFLHYTTASIIEYNFINRNVSYHYFSEKDFKWHVIKNKITMYDSYQITIQPFKFIAQFLLKLFGERKKQDKKIKDYLQKKRIESLYG